MKKKFKRLAICLAVMAISVMNYNMVSAGPQDTQETREPAAWGRGKQKWGGPAGRWSICCDSSTEYPCRQSTSNC